MMVVGEETVLKTGRPETELRGNDSRGKGRIKEVSNDRTKRKIFRINASHCIIQFKMFIHN